MTDTVTEAQHLTVYLTTAERRAANRRMVPQTTFLGEPYPQSFIHVIRVRDGKVVLQREYFNTEILADAERAARAKGRSPLA